MESARFKKTWLHEFYRIAFRKRLYATLEQRQPAVDACLEDDKTQRPPQGRWGQGTAAGVRGPGALAQEQRIGERASTPTSPTKVGARSPRVEPDGQIES